MNNWLRQLQDDLQSRRAAHLLRALSPATPDGPRITVGGRTLVNLAGNDYLGLAQHPHLKQAAITATEAHGTGSGASRLVSGTSPDHAALEARFARFKHAQSALLFPTGYMANLAVLTTLAREGDLVCVDKLNHASLLDAAHASGATVRVYPHGDCNKLQRLLSRHAGGVDGRKFIVTDSVFSMDGDVADLPALCNLAEQYDAVTVIDEAHGTGVLGDSGAGLCELQGVTDRVDVVVSTASKALGGLGGIVTAQKVVIDTLINHARSFIYTTAAPPAQVAAIGAALDVIENEPQRRRRLHNLSRRVREALKLPGQTPVIPVIVGPPEAAVALSQRLHDAGFYAPAIRPPTVAPGSSRVRLSLRADLEDGDVDRLLNVLA